MPRAPPEGLADAPRGGFGLEYGGGAEALGASGASGVPGALDALDASASADAPGAPAPPGMASRASSRPGSASGPGQAGQEIMFPPSIKRILQESSEAVREAKLRTRPGSASQFGLVRSERQLQDLPEFRFLCGVVRRWSNRELLLQVEGTTPQLTTGGPQAYNCRGQAGRARTSRVIETLLMHLPTGRRQAEDICRDAVRWVAERVATSGLPPEPWFPSYFNRLLEERGVPVSGAPDMDVLGLTTGWAPRGVPAPPASARGRRPRGLAGTGYRGGAGLLMEGGSAGSPGDAGAPRFRPADALGDFEAGVEERADRLERAERSASGAPGAPTAAIPAPLPPPQEPRVFRKPRPRPGSTYICRDRSNEFYRDSMDGLGAPRRYLAAAALGAAHGERLAVMAEEPEDDQSAQGGQGVARSPWGPKAARPVLAGPLESEVRQGVFTAPVRPVDRAPRHEKPLGAPYSSTMHRARSSLALARRLGMDRTQQDPDAPRAAVDERLRQLARQDAVLRGIEQDVRLAARSYHEGRVRAISARNTLREGARRGTGGYREVLAGRQSKAVPDYFLPSFRPRLNTLYGVEEPVRDRGRPAAGTPDGPDGPEQDSAISDDILDQEADYTGLGVGALNAARVQALVELGQRVDAERAVGGEAAGSARIPPSARVQMSARAMAEGDAGGSDEEDIEELLEREKAREAKAEADSRGAASSEAPTSEPGAAEHERRPHSAYKCRQAVAEYLTSQLSLPQFDHRTEPLADAGAAEVPVFTRNAAEAAKEQKRRELLSGGRYGLDPNLYQVLEASRRVFTDADLRINDAEANAPRRPRSGAPGASALGLSAASAASATSAGSGAGASGGSPGLAEGAPGDDDFIRDSEPSSDCSFPGEEAELAELRVEPRSAAFRALSEELGCVGPDLGQTDRLVPLVFAQAPGAKKKLVEKEKAEAEELAAQKAREKREREKLRAAASGQKPAAAKAKARPRSSRKAAPQASSRMVPYTPSGAPLTVVNLALREAEGSAGALRAVAEANRIRALAEAEAETSERQEQEYVDRRREEVRTTRALEPLVEIAGEAAKLAGGDSLAARNQVMAPLAKRRLGASLFRPEAEAAGSTRRLGVAGVALQPAEAVPATPSSVKPYAFSSGTVYQTLTRQVSYSSKPLHQEDDLTTHILERTYQPVGAPQVHPNSAAMTVPYDAPGFVAGVADLDSRVYARSPARSAEISKFFDDRFTVEADPRTAALRMQGRDVRTAIAVDPAVGARAAGSQVFTASVTESGAELASEASGEMVSSMRSLRSTQSQHGETGDRGPLERAQRASLRLSLGGRLLGSPSVGLGASPLRGGVREHGEMLARDIIDEDATQAVTTTAAAAETRGPLSARFSAGQAARRPETAPDGSQAGLTRYAPYTASTGFALQTTNPRSFQRQALAQERHGRGSVLPASDAVGLQLHAMRSQLLAEELAESGIRVLTRRPSSAGIPGASSAPALGAAALSATSALRRRGFALSEDVDPSAGQPPREAGTLAALSGMAPGIGADPCPRLPSAKKGAKGKKRASARKASAKRGKR